MQREPLHYPMSQRRVIVQLTPSVPYLTAQDEVDDSLSIAGPEQQAVLGTHDELLAAGDLEPLVHAHAGPQADVHLLGDLFLSPLRTLDLQDHSLEVPRVHALDFQTRHPVGDKGGGKG